MYKELFDITLDHFAIKGPLQRILNLNFDQKNVKFRPVGCKIRTKFNIKLEIFSEEIFKMKNLCRPVKIAKPVDFKISC